MLSCILKYVQAALEMILNPVLDGKSTLNTNSFTMNPVKLPRFVKQLSSPHIHCVNNTIDSRTLSIVNESVF